MRAGDEMRSMALVMLRVGEIIKITEGIADMVPDDELSNDDSVNELADILSDGVREAFRKRIDERKKELDDDKSGK